MGDNEQHLRRPEAIERHRPLQDLATRQHGVVSTRQLARLGYTRSSASKANGVGRLHRIHRGVYAVGHRDLTWHSRCLAAVLACTPAVASHLSAGWLWGVLRWRPDALHVTTPTKRGAKRSFVVHSADLSKMDLDLVDEIPVTALPRTYIDLAAMLTPQAIDGVLRRADELQIFDLGPIEDILDRAGGHTGRKRLREALAIYRHDPTFTRSGLERRFLKLVRMAGLPEPAMNFNVAGLELDAYWEAERFAVELDTFETHGSNAAFEVDRRREDDLLLAGVEAIRITGPRLNREPKAMIQRVAAHLSRRRKELQALGR